MWQNDDELRTQLAAFLSGQTWVKDSVVGTGIFNHRGIEIGAQVEWLTPERVHITDNSEGWSSLWAEGIVKTNLSSIDTERLESVARRMRVSFDRKKKCFFAQCELHEVGPTLTRVAVASTIVSGWTVVLSPPRDADSIAATTRVIDQVARIGVDRSWNTDQNVRIPAKDMNFLARATLVPKDAKKRDPVAIVPLSEDVDDVGPRISAWLYTTEVPVVFLATKRNFAEAERDVRDKSKARVVLRTSRAAVTAEAVLDSAAAVWMPLAS